MTSTAGDEIVAFSSPPVVEVVAGVSFDPLDAQMTALLASFWKDRLSRQFPSLQQQPPYYPPVEIFSSPKRSLNLAENFNAAFPSARLWATSSDGNELLQLQPGWFACNWRRVKPDSEYDRWAQRRQAFATWCDQLVSYLEETGGKDLRVRQCEVTYINHIELPNEESVHQQASAIFNGLQAFSSMNGFEQTAIQAEYVLKEDSGESYGRLHVKINPALGSNGRSELYVLELTARGKPLGQLGLAGVLETMDRGREAIVRAFLALTTEEMHEKWGIKR